MPGLYKSYKTNESLEKDGIRVEVGHTDDGKVIAFTLARAGGGNAAFLKKLNEKTKPYQRSGAMKELDVGIQRRIMKEVYAESVILGWENVDGPDGLPLAFSKENVLQVLTDLDDLFTELVSVATDAALFRASLLEAQAKN
jgi:hypothetical protein